MGLSGGHASQHEGQHADEDGDFTDPEEKRPAQQFNAGVSDLLAQADAEIGHGLPDPLESLVHFVPNVRAHTGHFKADLGCDRDEPVVKTLGGRVHHLVAPFISQACGVIFQIARGLFAQPFSKRPRHSLHDDAFLSEPDDDDAIVWERCQQPIRSDELAGDWWLVAGEDRMMIMRTAFLVALIAQLTSLPANRHATVTASPAEIASKAGAKVSLFVDIVPKPGIHVYAPGAKDYIAVALKLTPQADVKAGKATFPKSEMMFFEPLNEHVPVYQKAFRLTQDVTLGKTAKPGSTLTVAGTLSFQACDDRVCYAPESVPVSWAVTVR